MSLPVDGGLLAASFFGTPGAWLVVAAIIVCYLGATICINFLRSYGSGWMRAAKVYRATVRPRRGPTFFSYRSSFLHWTSPLRSNLATLTEQGIYLEAAYSFWRPFHPPLLLPWPSFRSGKLLPGKSPRVELSFEDPAGRRLRVPLPDTALPALRRWSGRDDFSKARLR